MSQLARPQAITGSSLISRVPISAPESVPWNWNPGATFVTAFNDAQENQRAQQEFQMDMELEKILFPLKVQTAQMNFEKLVQDRDRTMLLNEQIRQARRNASGGINSAISGASNGGAVQQGAQDATSFNLTGTIYDRTQATQSQPQAGSQPVAKKKVVDLTGI